MGTIIAYSGDQYNYLGYAIGGEFGGLFINVNESPLIVCDRMIIGVLNNRRLQQYFFVNGHKPADTSYKTILQSLDFIKGFEHFHSGELVILSSDGNIYYWKEGVMYDIRGKYFAIGDGRDVAMGCMYGLRSADFTDQEKVEITLKAISYNRPHQAMTTGFERI